MLSKPESSAAGAESAKAIVISPPDRLLILFFFFLHKILFLFSDVEHYCVLPDLVRIKRKSCYIE